MPVARTLNRPGFRAYFLSWEGCDVHASQVQPGHEGQGYPAGPRARRGLRIGVRGDQRGRRPARDERGDTAQVDPPGRGGPGPGARGDQRGRPGDQGAEAQEHGAGADHRDPEGRDKFLRAGARPAAPLICAFIDAHRDRFGVVPICRALSAHGVPIAPRTYWARRSRPPSRRALAAAAVTEVLALIYEADARERKAAESLYGSLKVWAHLRRQGVGVARCTVERL